MTVLNRTNIASIIFNDGNGVHIRVYYQDREGNIRETFYDQSTGWALRELDIVGVGRLNTGIAVTTWNQGTQIRVYFFDKENRLVERCYQGGAAGSWTDGYLTAQSFVGSAVSYVAATGNFSNGPNLRVYYQGVDGFIYETTNTRSSNGRPWATKKIDLPAVPLGSSVAATFLSDGRKRRVYTTNVQNQLIELCTDDGESWFPGATLFTPGGENRQIGAGIACVAWAKDGGERISVFSITADNKVVCNKTGDTEWEPPFVIAECITFSAVAGFRRLTDTRFNIYFQSEGKHIIEYTSDIEGGGFWPNQRDLPLRQ